MELNDHKLTNEEFVSEMQEEGLNDSIYVYTPKGDVFRVTNRCNANRLCL